MRVRGIWGLVWLACACSAPNDRGTSRTADEPSRAKPSGATASVASSLPSSAPSASPLPALPAQIPKGPTHYANTTPPPPNTSCTPLPSGGSSAFRALAVATRRLSCEPALFYLTTEELKAELALPASHSVAFVGTSSVSIRFPKGSSSDLATALGLRGAVAARRNRGAWGWRIWDMVTDPEAGKLQLWSPGEVSIGVDVETAGLEDEVKSVPLDKSTLDGQLSVSLPDSTLPIVDDPIAFAMLIRGLDKIASDPERLRDEPAALAALVGLDNERFRLSRRSSYSGASEVKGIDVWTNRTQVAAGPVIEALELYGEIKHTDAHDSDELLLFQKKKTELPWRKLKVELAFSKRGGAAAAGPYGAWTLDRVTLMP